jgi:hypothetical protein
LAVALGGLPIGIVAGRIVYRSFVGRIGATESVTMPIAVLALTIAGLLLLANLVAAPNARQARRRSPSRVLARE